jgi:Membrane-bound metallopeptidase
VPHSPNFRRPVRTLADELGLAPHHLRPNSASPAALQMETAATLEPLATRPAAQAPPAPSVLPPPALGRLAARHGDPGPDGPRRGVALETAPYALVRAPALATLRHVGPLPGRGLAAALEPADGLLIVLSGLDRVDRAPGEILRAGEPLGAMGGPPPSAEEFLIDASRAEASIPTETIYIETWRDGAPADPETWFAFDSEGTSG